MLLPISCVIKSAHQAIEHLIGCHHYDLKRFSQNNINQIEIEINFILMENFENT